MKENIKAFLENVIGEIGQKKFLLLKRLNILLSWTYIIEHLNRWRKKRIAKDKSKEFRSKKLIKNKADKLYVKWKDHDNSFNSWKGRKSYIKSVILLNCIFIVETK